MDIPLNEDETDKHDHSNHGITLLEKQTNVVTRFFQENRHVDEIVGMREELQQKDAWKRYSKDRMKTVSVALVMCLHIGVDPPDSGPKPNPRAKLEMWFDPFSCSPNKAATKITQTLQKAYEKWQPRARYKHLIDPTIDDVKSLCTSMRRNSKEDRVLFHYNGHGVPRPTQNGEIWVFNKSFTQYIPLSIYDLQAWMSSPSIYVWDCSAAEVIVNSFNRFADDHVREWQKEFDDFQERGNLPLPPITSHMTQDEQAEKLNFDKKRPRFKDCIQLGACRADEFLPTNPDLPADLFTACLTSPIQTSVLWYLIKTGRKKQFSDTILDEIPGQAVDRRSVMGELNWIFTAITDTIAWNSLPRDDFHKLFRQDLLLASLFRSFLLAEKVMSAHGCNVVSSPSLPSTSDHPLWESWEYTLDLTLKYLANLQSAKDKDYLSVGRDHFYRSSHELSYLIDFNYNTPTEQQHSWFFIEQLNAFEIWLDYGVDRNKPPQQLPIVLQVLLSQAHRLRALELLAKFLDLGQWAIDFSLSVGIFPYVLKLLQSNTKELRPWLSFIWAKILAVEPNYQTELFKENGEDAPQGTPQRTVKTEQLRFLYFANYLEDHETPPRQKVVPAFIIAILNNTKEAQKNFTDRGFINSAIGLLTGPEAHQFRLLKVWLLIGIGRLWAEYDDARWQAVRLDSYSKVFKELKNVSPEVRAAAIYALGCLVRNKSEYNEHAFYIDQQVSDEICKCTRDGAALVREELIVALQWYILEFEDRFAKMLLNLMDKLRIDLEDDDKEIEKADDAMTVTDKNGRLLNGNERSPSAFGMNIERQSSYRRMRNSHSVNGYYAEEPIRRSGSLYVDSEFNIANSDPSDISFRNRAIAQIEALEKRTFTEPLERTWLSLLRLSLDPINKIARMAQALVKKVETHAIVEKKRITSKISVNLSNYIDEKYQSSEVDDDPIETEEAAGNSEVRFIVGSPLGPMESSPTDRDMIDHASPRVPSPAPSSGGGSSRSHPVKPSIHSRNSSKAAKDTSIDNIRRRVVQQPFTPKRDMRKGQFSTASTAETKKREQLQPIVKTHFVDWCSKVFAAPILHLIHGNLTDVDNLTDDRVITQTNMTDWAEHMEEAQKQLAENEFDGRKPCDSQLVAARIPPSKTGKLTLAMSLLRKYIYACDGEQVYMIRNDSQKTEIARHFKCAADSPFTTDQTTSLILINSRSKEMLMCGSQNGIVRIWDPQFSIHSQEFEGVPNLVSASLPLNDQFRQSYSPENTTIYE
ncbi:hypothetical protein WR25_21626 isoform A [Diploscapter pachys]|uniref:Raptor N-terminal CASPase-like domain-containing protein n=1 Tax=Diploscapter pachys TaxID=2018661 RepID=A0A2A2LUI2_9BILA|nr:hypothetical protein WR25_21626 isoform A [Diploscapter pachys]